MGKTAEPKFKIGQDVYLIADPEQAQLQIVAVVITPNGYEYTVRILGELVDVFDIELSEQKNVI